MRKDPKYRNSYTGYKNQGPANRNYEAWTKGKVRTTVTLRCLGGALTVLDVYNMVEEGAPFRPPSTNAWVPYSWQDAGGRFEVERSGWFAKTYTKVYVDGLFAGERVPISTNEGAKYEKAADDYNKERKNNAAIGIREGA